MQKSLALIFFHLTALWGAEEGGYTMRRSAKMEDQGGAASGYVYHTDSKGPVSYMSFNSHTGNPEKFYPKPVPLFAYVQKDGSSYNAAEHSKKGEKGSEGYLKDHAYAKGAKGHHDNAEEKGHYSAGGGHKNSHHDSGSGYASKHQDAKASKGGSFSQEKNHKKGSKTTGFHKVYHKDEYKKDHTFYDEADAKGHYDKHGSSSSHHSSEKGGHKKGGHSDEGYNEDEYAKAAAHDKGHHDSKDSGFKGEKGNEEYHKNFADYAEEGGKKGSKEYGYDEGKDDVVDDDDDDDDDDDKK